jgi:hypothetical protein
MASGNIVVKVEITDETKKAFQDLTDAFTKLAEAFGISLASTEKLGEAHNLIAASQPQVDN